MEVRYYKTKDGKEPFTEWLKALKDQHAVKQIRKRIDRLYLGNLGDYKGADGVLELRIHYGPGYRLYCGLDGETVIIMLCGGDKSSQQKDIKQAKEYWNEYHASK